MTKRPRVYFWFGGVFGLIAAFYTFGSFVFYAWMNANGWSANALLSGLTLVWR